MVKRLWRPAVLAMLVVAVAAVGGTAAAKSKKASNKATVTAKGKFTSKYKVNKRAIFESNERFTPGTVRIKSGGTLTIRSKSPEPHTFSIVTKKQLPKNRKQLDNCGSPGTICDTLNTAHQVGPDGNPAKPVVDIGAAGIDQPGDSFVLNPKSSQKVAVSAKAGTTLLFVCAIHPWMQGKLKVR
jgi:plastocyanin